MAIRATTKANIIYTIIDLTKYKAYSNKTTNTITPTARSIPLAIILEFIFFNFLL
ncbi:hypothetical protein CCYN74_70023 [Capnocytophaga cynodegmi]|uniref:Uncharacterized protein n=1 Tax=Capnocytophaga cynodegmi TaxID=28189 RepID=A0A0B7HU95_9FLAO|nr:hypothetical protein CCYN74_70023 [Capnocytophaga cynodegmi]